MKIPVLYRYNDLLLDRKRYHGNCRKLEEKLLYKKAKRGKYIYCVKHKVNCSRTGWQWGWYGGTYSKALK